MKVLLISHSCAQRHAGQARAEYLAASGVHLTVLTPARWNEYGRIVTPEMPLKSGFRMVSGRTAAAFPLIPIRGRAMAWQWYTHWYPRALSRLLHEMQPDVVDIWEEPWSAVAAQAVYLRDRICPHSRIVIETEQNIYKRIPPPFSRFQRYVLNRTDFAVARSEHALEVLRQKGYSGSAAVIGNGVDTDLFEPMSREACRNAAGIQDLDIVVGYAGRIEPEKGLETVLHALTRLPDRVGFYVIGAGSAETELRARAESLGVARRVRWRAPLSPEALPSHLNAMDAFVLPSRTTVHWREQFGRVLIEAMACGLPVFGAASGAIPEVLGSAGELFPEGDEEALAICLGRLVDAATAPAAPRVDARRHAVENYSWERIAHRYREAYSSALAAPESLSAVRTEAVVRTFVPEPDD